MAFTLQVVFFAALHGSQAPCGPRYIALRQIWPGISARNSSRTGRFVRKLLENWKRTGPSLLSRPYSVLNC